MLAIWGFFFYGLCVYSCIDGHHGHFYKAVTGLGKRVMMSRVIVF